MAETDTAIDEQAAPEYTPRRGRRIFRFLIVMFFSVLGPVAIALGAVYFYATGGRFASTENAYVKADKIAVSSDVSGRVVAVKVAENQEIHKGDLLFRIDPEAFDIALSQAEARIASARQTIAALKAEYRQKVAERREAEGEVAFYKRRVERQRKLHGKGFASQSKLDDAEHELSAARDRIPAINQDLARVRARLGGDVGIDAAAHPTVREAQSARDAMALQLRRTEVRAPTDGVITNFGLEVGEYIEAGAPIFSLVGTGQVWVRANYKETDLTYVRVGQMATLSVDTYPDVSFQARVASISPATGAEFALLPPQNASGNWVKVVQRLPVRLELIKSYNGPPLRAGMSVVVEIDTGHKRKVPGVISQAMAWMDERL
ncbi:MAG: HlyD family secretion protein [Rhodospirillaceae bacterium]|nr:HlyD family secretion protein [Rhodospirillaceae bacterium]